MTTWRKSSRSTSTTNCVEIANTLDQLRDSKNMAVTLRVDVRRLIESVVSGDLAGR